MPGTELANIDERQFLAKPYRPATLMEVVRRCLDEPLAEMAGAGRVTKSCHGRVLT